MIEVVECEGAPRDLGLDQGLSCREFLNSAFGSEPSWRRLRLWAGLGTAQVRQMRRDLQRFFPGQAESIDAMAYAARVPRAWLLERFTDSSRSLPISDSLAVAAGLAKTGEGGLLARNLPADVIFRRCRPDHGFSSIELCQPWQTAPLAGVNEAGISVVCLVEGGEFDSSGGEAPAFLLAQDCLRRFDHLDGAVEWLLTRPGGGRSTFILADSAGEIVGVHAVGRKRTIFRPADGLIVHTGRIHGNDGLTNALRKPSRLTVPDLGLVFGTPMVVVEAVSRRITVRGIPSDSDVVRLGVSA